MSADAVAFFDDDQDPPQPAELARVEIPGDIPRGRGGRPKIRRLLQDGSEDPTTTVEYTRASSLGEVLEDHYAIHARETRMVIHTMGHDPGLRARAQSVATHGPDREDPAHQRDRRSLREIHETALIVCRASSGADRGTAFHALTEQFDQGLSMGHLDDDMAIGMTRYAELMAGFEIVGSEGFVVCDELETAGSYDRIVAARWPTEIATQVAGKRTVLATIAAGDRIVLDLKTNADAKHFGPQYAVQQAVYAHGVPYPVNPKTGERGRGVWTLAKGQRYSLISKLEPRRDWSLILHIPIESPDDAGLWWVDLTAGMELARAAAAARVLRRRAGMFLPAEPPAPPAFDYASVAAVVPIPNELLGDATDDLPERAPLTWKQETLAAYDADEAEQERIAAAGVEEVHTAAAIVEVIDAELAKRERTIIGLVHAARTLDDLGRTWERYGADGWTPACTAAANAQADKLSPAAVSS